MELEEARQEIYREIKRESDRRLELIRKAFTSPPGRLDSILGDIKDIETDLEDWR